MKLNPAPVALCAGLIPMLPASAQPQPGPAVPPSATTPSETHVPVTFTGGHETDPRDGGRPVSLIAAALGVPADVFRAAFRNVRPAPAGQQPEPGQVRQNKAALLRALGPYGITNEWLDTVSNYYRYNRQRGEMWPSTPAAAYATIKNGVVAAITITNPGAGYSSPPHISIPGAPAIQVDVQLRFTQSSRTNGSIAAIPLRASSSDSTGTPAP